MGDDDEGGGGGGGPESFPPGLLRAGLPRAERGGRGELRPRL